MSAAHALVMPTRIVDRPSPANDTAQNGIPCRQGGLASRRPHVHRRFSVYDGPVAHATATMLAIHAARPNSSVPLARTTTLMVVEITDTPMQRVSFCASDRGCATASRGTVGASSWSSTTRVSCCAAERLLNPRLLRRIRVGYRGAAGAGSR